MANKVRKTEHSGAKHSGGGAYWGPKKEAKAMSNRLRREQAKEVRRGLEEGD